MNAMDPHARAERPNERALDEGRSSARETSRRGSPAGAPNDVDLILEDLRPRMRKARVGHVRRMSAALAVLPVLGLGAAALAGGDTGSTVTAAGGGSDGENQIRTDEAAFVTGEPARSGGGLPDDPSDAPADARSDDPPEEEHAAGKTEAGDPNGAVAAGEELVELASFGEAKVRIEQDGTLVLVEVIADDGWDVLGVDDTGEGDLVITLSDGDVVKIITIESGLWHEIHVRVDDPVEPRPAPAPAPPPAAEPEPEPPSEPIVDRIVLEVSPAGSFVVEREGGSLWAGNVQPNPGFEHDIILSQGWEVHVAFFDPGFVHHGRAWIDDDGGLRTKVWSEERQAVPAPVTQVVEVPGAGVVKLSYHDGLMHVDDIGPAEGFSSYVYNEVGETVKVDFEGEGQLWIVEAWAVEGVIRWTISGPTI